MKSRSQSDGLPRAQSRGFTLFEVLIVITIVAIVTGFGLFVSFDTFRGTSFRTDRDLLIALLQHARSQAVSNVCNGACTDCIGHGVYVDPIARTYTAFEGATYTTRNAALDQKFNAAPGVIASGDAEVDFAQLTGTVGVTRNMTITAGPKTSTITIDTSGRILWTN